MSPKTQKVILCNSRIHFSTNISSLTRLANEEFVPNGTNILRGDFFYKHFVSNETLMIDDYIICPPPFLRVTNDVKREKIDKLCVTVQLESSLYNFVSCWSS